MKGIFLLLFALFISGELFGQARIFHSPSREVYSNMPLLIEAIIEGNRAGVQRVRILYRETGQSAYIEDDMAEYMGVYKIMVPAESVKESGIEYLIVAEFSDGSMAAYPEVDPYNVPIFLTVRKKTGIAEKGLETNKDAQEGIPTNAIVLSPEEGEIVPASEVIIAVSLFTVPDVSLQSVRVEIDGKNITQEAEITEDLISVHPKNLSPGIHTVKLMMNNLRGDHLAPIIANFTVVRTVEEAQRFSDVTGQVFSEASSEQIRGVRQNISQVRGNMNGRFDWLEFNAQTLLTSLEDPNKQPRNRFTVGLKSSFLDLKFGDVNPRLSEFGLNGKRVRGIEANLKLKYFNCHFITGETERLVPGTISDIPDTTVNSLEYLRSGYTYSRKLMAFHPYFGIGQHFQFGLSLIKAIDDTLSVKQNFGGIHKDTGVDICMAGANKPQDNIVLGTDLLLSFDNQRFIWKTDFAFSYLNRNISGGAITLHELDTFMPGDSLVNDTLTFQGTTIALKDIPFDPQDISWIFIINKNIKPLLPVVPDSNGNFLNLHSILNMPSSAFKTQLALNYFNNYLTFRYQRVGPEFVSLGNPYQRFDVQGFQIGDKIRLFSNRIFANLNCEQLRDNLNKDKNCTTVTTTFSAGLSLYPGEGLPTINFNTMQYGRKNDIEEIDTTFYMNPATADIDSFILKDHRESNVTIRQDINISHLIEFAGAKHNIQLSYANSNRSDQVKGRNPIYRFNSMSTAMISFGMNSSFSFPLKTFLNISTNKNESDLSSKPYEFLSVSAQGQYDFFNGQLSALTGYNLMSGSGLVDFFRHNVYVGAYYQFFKIHMIRGRLNYTLLDDRLTSETFNDLSFNLSYSIDF